MKILIFLLILSIIAIGITIWFWQLKRKDIKRATIIYIVLSILILTLVGFLGMAVYISPPRIYLIILLIFLLLGIVHSSIMYSLNWAKKKTGDPSKDSFLPELLFTLLIGLYGLILYSLNFSLWNEDYPLVFSTAILSFPIPFLFLKTFHFSTHIKAPEFDKKARWDQFSDTLGTEMELALRFQVAGTFEQERNPFHKRRTFRMAMANEDLLGNVFRYGIEEVNTEEDDIEIEDLERGGENKVPDFWWLFVVKTVLWKPSTWSRKIRYLDPFISVKDNRLRDGDIVIAKRIVF